MANLCFRFFLTRFIWRRLNLVRRCYIPICSSNSGLRVFIARKVPFPFRLLENLVLYIRPDEVGALDLLYSWVEQRSHVDIRNTMETGIWFVFVGNLLFAFSFRRRLYHLSHDLHGPYTILCNFVLQTKTVNNQCYSGTILEYKGLVRYSSL